MSTNGDLKFQGTNRATFVGATSNIMFDTTSTSLGIGVTGTDHPSSNLYITGNAYVTSDIGVGGVLTMGTVNVVARHDLESVTATGNTTPLTVEFQNADTSLVASGNVETKNINMLHTANTASIKLNSNVVTEFPRSRKLIKYPRVAMTGQTTSNYTVTGSSWYGSSALGGSGTEYFPWKAFDNVGNSPNGALAWYSFDYSGTEAYSGSDYAFNPSHGGTATPVLFTGAVQGEWLKIQLPHKVALDHYIMYGPNQESEFPRDWTVYGSVDGTNWNWIDSRIAQIFGDGTGSGGTATSKRKEFYLDTPTNEYLYFGFVFTRSSVNRAQYVGIGEIELYGIPEYDPEAYGTDVTLKSLTNVPNTDWLEVYYDAKNYTNGVVQDETSNNRDAEMNATFDNGEIKAFSFSGAYTSNVTTSDHGLGTGDVTYTISYWFKRTAVAGTYDYLCLLGNGGTSYSSILMWINANQLVLDHWSAALRVLDPIKFDKWYHVAAGHKGGNTPSLENDFIYIDGKKVTPEITQTAAPFTLAGSKLTLGTSHFTQTEFLNGKIANFRLFDRALNSDEIHQLYAYQKEYFGHGDLSLTIKEGQLGIGTSEPRAALDVRGMLKISDTIDSPFFKVFSIFDKQNPTVNDSHWSSSVEGIIRANSTVIVIVNVGGYKSSGGNGTFSIQYRKAGTTSFLGLSDIFLYFNRAQTHVYRNRTFVWKPTVDIHFIEWKITFNRSCNEDDKADMVLVVLPV